MTKPKASWSFRSLPKKVDIHRVIREANGARAIIAQCGKEAPVLLLRADFAKVACAHGLLSSTWLTQHEIDGRKYAIVARDVMTEDAFIELVVKTRALEKEVVRTRVVLL